MDTKEKIKKLIIDVAEYHKKTMHSLLDDLKKICETQDFEEKIEKLRNKYLITEKTAINDEELKNTAIVIGTTIATNTTKEAKEAEKKEEVAEVAEVAVAEKKEEVAVAKEAEKKEEVAEVAVAEKKEEVAEVAVAEKKEESLATVIAIGIINAMNEAEPNTIEEKIKVKNLAVAEKEAADRLVAAKAEADRIAAEKEAADRASIIIGTTIAMNDTAAEKAAAEKVAAEKAAAEKVAAEKAAAEKVAAEKAAAEKAEEQNIIKTAQTKLDEIKKSLKGLSNLKNNLKDVNPEEKKYHFIINKALNSTLNDLERYNNEMNTILSSEAMKKIKEDNKNPIIEEFNKYTNILKITKMLHYMTNYIDSEAKDDYEIQPSLEYRE